MATPQFWIYIIVGLVLSFIVAVQFGLVPKTTASTVSHPDLNAMDRPDPGVPAESSKTATTQAASVTPPLPADEPVSSVTARAGTEAPVTAPVRQFEPPLPIRREAPKPYMPPAAAAPEPVTPSRTATLPQNAPPVHTPNVQPADPPPPAPEVKEEKAETPAPVEPAEKPAPQ